MAGGLSARTLRTIWSHDRSSSAVTAPGHGRREAAPTIVEMGQDVADDGESRGGADHVGARGGHELAVDTHPEVHAVGDRARWQPRREAELVQAVELADLDREQPLDRGRIGPEARAVDPHPDHLRARVHAVVGLDGGEHRRSRGDVRGARTDDVPEHRADPVGATHHEQGLRRRAGVLHPDRDELIVVVCGAPAGPPELALLEVADRIGRVQAVLGKEGVEQLAVGRLAGDGRGTPADGDGGHQDSGASAPPESPRASPLGSWRPGWRSGTGPRSRGSRRGAARAGRRPRRGPRRRAPGPRPRRCDSRDELGRRHVERRIAHVRLRRGDAHAADVQGPRWPCAPRSGWPRRPACRGRPC